MQYYEMTYENYKRNIKSTGTKESSYYKSLRQGYKIQKYKHKLVDFCRESSFKLKILSVPNQLQNKNKKSKQRTLKNNKTNKMKLKLIDLIKNN